MQIKEIDTKKNRIVIHVDSIDDFYYLLNFIRKGDIVTAKTTRKVTMGGEEGESVRVPMTISLSVETVSFQEFVDRLRIKGRIIKGPQNLVSLGSYHTINIEKGDTFELVREEGFSKIDLDYLKQSEKMKQKPPIILIAISDEEASIGVLSTIGLTVIGNYTHNLPAKHIGTHREVISQQNAFFRKITDILREAINKYDTKLVIVAGPGFTKEHFAEFLKNQLGELKVYVDNVSNSTINGLYEIVKRGLPEKIIEEHQIVEETKLIEELFLHLGKGDGLIAIGLEETYRAVEYGVAEKILVSSSKLRTLDGEEREKLFELLKMAENYNMKIFFISNLHPHGEQFEKLGGIAAILRYRVELQ